MRIVHRFLTDVAELLNVDYNDLSLESDNGKLTDRNVRSSKHWVNYAESYDPRRYYLRLRGTKIHQFVLVMLPGNCAFCISTRMRTYGPHKRKGLATRSVKFQMELAQVMGFSAFLATDVERNDATTKIAEKVGMEKVVKLTNKRTANPVWLGYKQIRR